MCHSVIWHTLCRKQLNSELWAQLTTTYCTKDMHSRLHHKKHLAIQCKHILFFKQAKCICSSIYGFALSSYKVALPPLPGPYLSSADFNPELKMLIECVIILLINRQCQGFSYNSLNEILRKDSPQNKISINYIMENLASAFIYASIQ